MPPDDRPRRRQPIARVVASYGGTPCTTLRPLDAPVRPGEPCGEIHEHCRGHVRGKDRPNYGDPCGASALPGICTCGDHGGQLPESAAIVKRERARRLVGQLVGDDGPVTDPLGELARVLGEKRALRNALRELVQQIQAGEHLDGDGDDRANLLIEAGGHWVKRGEDGEVVDEGYHPSVTGSIIVRDPGDRYVIHPLVEYYERVDRDYTAALAAAGKLGIEERAVSLEEAQIDLTLATVRHTFELLLSVHPAAAALFSPDDAMGLFATAARNLDAVGGATTRELIEGHVVRQVEAGGDLFP